MQDKLSGMVKKRYFGDKSIMKKSGKADGKNTGKAVLVTGASSGIGYATARYLADQGFLVFAGVRKETDVRKLESLGNPRLVPSYPLELTEMKDIKNISRFIRSGLEENNLEGLYGIVNAAGGGSIAPLELLDLNTFDKELRTRILGSVGLLQSLLPLIRKAHGRILWIATPATIPSPFLTDIHACDFAVNFIARTAQIELQKWNIPSILIRCGGIDTPAPERTMKALKAAMRRWPREKYSLYEEVLQREIHELAAFDKRRTAPVEVAKVVYKALTADKPGRRYRVGYMSGFAAFLELFPQVIVDAVLERRYR